VLLYRISPSAGLLFEYVIVLKLNRIPAFSPCDPVYPLDPVNPLSPTLVKFIFKFSPL